MEDEPPLSQLSAMSDDEFQGMLAAAGSRAEDHPESPRAAPAGSDQATTAADEDGQACIAAALVSCLHEF